jgi:hypothetical protein
MKGRAVALRLLLAIIVGVNLGLGAAKLYLLSLDRVPPSGVVVASLVGLGTAVFVFIVTGRW